MPFRCLLVLSACPVLLASCSSMRWRHEKPVSTAMAPAQHPGMSRAFERAGAAHPGESGLHLLASNESAFASRLVLADEARETLDVQSYILHWDTTGRLLIDRLLRAADRGVRVRLLVDDLELLGFDPHLRAIDAHPQIEVRLFNPFLEREDNSGLSRVFQFLLDSRRLNRRMHIKLFAADNRVAIVGGRNLGDEYFTSRQGTHFKDLDVLAVGSVVREASEMFDLYWNNRWAVPVAAFRTGQAKRRDLAGLRQWRSELEATIGSATVQEKLAASGWPKRLRTGTVDLTWSSVRLIYDRPEKIGRAFEPEVESPIGPEMFARARQCRRELIVVSSYFVPGREGVALLRELRQRGVRVRVLTNSLAATDVPVVHGGYERYRGDLLRAGVEIYEMKPDAQPRRHWRARSMTSGTCLHAKAFLFDDSGVVIGSFNADPRSAHLNTEVGVVAESPQLSRQVRALFEEAIRPEASYRVTLDPAGRPVWLSEQEGRPLVQHGEPRAGLLRRFLATLAKLVPIEGLL